MAKRSEILESARKRLSLSIVDLWIAYLAIGGHASFDGVESFLDGSVHPNGPEYDLLAQALNDEFIGRHLDNVVPYFHELAL